MQLTGDCGKHKANEWIVALVAFVILGSAQIDTSGRGWKNLYNQGVNDKKEYYDNRFKLF